jgi:hypothetical protein
MSARESKSNVHSSLDSTVTKVNRIARCKQQQNSVREKLRVKANDVI